MNILFDIGHPAHVHLFRYVIEKLKKNGHKVIITVKDIPSAIYLLNVFNLDYISLGKKSDSMILKGLKQIRYTLDLLKISIKNEIDIAVGSSMTITHASKFYKMKSIVLDDDDADAVYLFSRFAHPFADCILSPAALKDQRLSPKDITYKGSKELFYLHSNYFTPDSSVLDKIGISLDEPFFVFRFVAVKAYHDIGQEGLTLDQKLLLINEVKPYGKVFITTERNIEPEIKEYQLKFPEEMIHHLLYYATLYIGDSQTMTSEAAILGTPSLKCNTFAHRLSLPNELEYEYDLCYAYKPSEFPKMVDKLRELLRSKNIKEQWKLKQTKFLNDKIDPTLFLTWFIEQYPASFNKMKIDPEYQENFK